MKVAVIHSFYSSRVPSGENSVVLSQVSALQQAGHDVLLISRHTDIEAEANFYKFHAFLSAANISGASPHEALEQFRPDIVHVHNLFPNWGSNWLIKWGGQTVATLHNFRTVCASGLLWRAGHDCALCLSGSSLNAIRYRCYKGSVASSVPLSYATRAHGKHSPVLTLPKALVVLNDRALEVFGSLGIKVELHLIPNFAAKYADDAKDDETKAAAPSGWVYVGRLAVEKGVDWLIANWPRVGRLTFVGAGPLERAVEAAAERDPSRFRHLGQLPSLETRRQISSAQGLLLPSLWGEGLPTVALEALQSGTPVIVSNRCSSAGELTAARAGVTFNVRDGESGLRSALNEVTYSGPIMRASAAQNYQQRYSEEIWVEHIEKVYRGILDG